MSRTGSDDRVGGYTTTTATMSAEGEAGFCIFASVGKRGHVFPRPQHGRSAMLINVNIMFQVIFFPFSL